MSTRLFAMFSVFGVDLIRRAYALVAYYVSGQSRDEDVEDDDFVRYTMTATLRRGQVTVINLGSVSYSLPDSTA